MTDEPVIREAQCRCGQLRARCVGEPVRVSVCHCLDCQRRSGSAFSAQARWPNDQVALTGEARTWSHTGDGGGRTDFHFCPHCGATVTYQGGGLPGLTAVAIGAFADPAFPPPRISVWEKRQHPWTGVLGPDVEHID